MSARRTRPAEAGFTMLELVASVLLFAVTVTVAVHSSLVSGRVTASLVSSSELDLRVHRVLDQVAEELLQARLESLTPAPEAPYGASAVNYDRAEASPTGGIVWSNTRRLEYVQPTSEPQDGIDNDGDGLVDEGELWLVTDVGLPGERRTLLSRHVASFLAGEKENVVDDNANGLVDERGLSFELRDGALLVRLALQAVLSDGAVATRTAETAVRMRN